MLYIICSFIWLLASLGSAFAQDSSNASFIEEGGFHPTLSFDISGDARLRSGAGFAIENTFLTSSLRLTESFSLYGLVRAVYDSGINWYDFTRRRYKLNQINAEFSGTVPISTINTTYSIQFGQMQWYPDFVEPRLILENINLYTNPITYFGAQLSLGALLYESYRISAHAEGYSGDLVTQKVKPKFTEAVLRAAPQLIGELGIRAQVGKSASSVHVVNHAYFIYTHTFLDYLTVNLQAGKLVGREDTPYGLHIELSGSFKYAEVGAYYERRLAQAPETQIMGFYYRIIGPKELVWVLGTYQPLYDLNTGTFRFIIPFIRGEINW